MRILILYKLVQYKSTIYKVKFSILFQLLAETSMWICLQQSIINWAKNSMRQKIIPAKWSVNNGKVTRCKYAVLRLAANVKAKGKNIK